MVSQISDRFKIDNTYVASATKNKATYTEKRDRCTGVAKHSKQKHGMVYQTTRP